MNTNNKTCPTIVVIFGGNGDLSKRKLIPAFYNLYLDGWIPDHFAVIGLGRSDSDDQDFRDRLYEGLTEFSRSGKPSEEKWNKFQSNLFYMQSDINDESSYQRLSDKINELETAWGARANRMFYLSVAPRF
ncbi:MAG: glucose-6-phosphate dehydrogenase, partial [Flavitalea sp.]